MSLFRLVASLRGAAILLSLGLLSACTVVVEEPRPGPRPLPQVCTMEYAPVCGQRGDLLRTFPNACHARADGFRVVHRGACRADLRPETPRICTREYAPVCAVRGRRAETFANACMARADGFRVVHRGECR
ncbi:protease inhibitor [Ensifer sp. LCM 4579]|nr:protease inhibitor [Ensifer sp. LCM 4579]